MTKKKSDENAKKTANEQPSEDDLYKVENWGLNGFLDGSSERCEFCGSTFEVRSDLGIPLCETCFDAQTS